MKNILILAIIALTAANSQGQTTECDELLYTPHYINPVPTIADSIPTDTLEDNSPAPPEGEDTRGIFWVHGLGGNKYSWDGPYAATSLGAQGFPARDVIMAQVTYGDNSLYYAGGNLESEILEKKVTFAQYVPDHLRNYVIAHSQGGLVSRMTDKQYDDLPSDRRMFGGIVTFGTPHGGAYILNSRNAGRIEELAADGCKALGAVELLLALGQNVSPFFFNITSGGVLSTLNGACDIASAILPNALFAELNTPISDDYLVGASELGDLNTHGNPEVYKVAMHGVEYADGEDPVFPKQLMWRTFSSREASSAPVFGADDDDEMVNFANQQTARYLQEFHHNLKLAIYHSFKGGFLGFNPKVNKYIKLANAFKGAYDFMQTADDKWKIIIGAKGIQWVNSPTDPCQCIRITPETDYAQELVGISALDNEMDCISYYYYDPITGEVIGNCAWQPLVWESFVKPSDGVVVQESQMAFPGALPRYMDMTNHFQMRNSSKTKEALLDLYKGDLLQFFETKVR